jgi:hypothetical protein
LVTTTINKPLESAGSYIPHERNDKYQRERSHSMGDKGGKKDKDKSQKQKEAAQKKKMK